MGTGELRGRALLDRYFGLLVLVLLLVAALGGYVTYGTYGKTTMRTETTSKTVSQWSSGGQFVHHARVVNGTRVFPEGSILENRSVYYRKIAPVLNGSFVYNYTASESGSLDADVSVDLLVHAVGDSQGDAREYWRFTDSLGSTSASLKPGESVRVPFSRNVTEINAEIQHVESQLGQSPGTPETVFRATVRLNGTRNSRPVATNRTYTLPLSIENDVYRLNDSGVVGNHGSQVARRQVSTPVSHGLLERVGAPVVFVVALACLLALAVGRYQHRFELSADERAYLTFRSDRTEFDEWITEATVPKERLDAAETLVETTTLAGLVDLAIDSDRRVIETADHDRYLVLDGDLLYSYEPPSPGDTEDDPLGPGDASTLPGGLFGTDAAGGDDPDAPSDAEDGDADAPADAASADETSESIEGDSESTEAEVDSNDDDLEN